MIKYWIVLCMIVTLLTMVCFLVHIKKWNALISFEIMIAIITALFVADIPMAVSCGKNMNAKIHDVFISGPQSLFSCVIADNRMLIGDLNLTKREFQNEAVYAVTYLPCTKMVIYIEENK